MYKSNCLEAFSSLFIMPRSPELITLISDDEDSLLSEEVTPISSNKVPIKLKESARKSISIKNKIESIMILESNKPSALKSNSSHNSKMILNGSSVTNNTNLSISKIVSKKLSQTARKSTSSLRSSQNILSNNNCNIELIEKQVHNKKVSHNHITADCSQSTINNWYTNKAATISTKVPNKNIPFEKLKERGITISPSVGHLNVEKSSPNMIQLSDSRSRSTNDDSSLTNKKNLGQLRITPVLHSKLKPYEQLNGVSKITSENSQFQNSNKHISEKSDKDASLWSKKKRLTGLESELGSQSKNKNSLIRQGTNDDFKRGNQSKNKNSEVRHLITTEARSENLPKHEMTENETGTKVPILANSCSNVKENRTKESTCLKIPSNVIVVSPGGTAFRSDTINNKTVSTSMNTHNVSPLVQAIPISSSNLSVNTESDAMNSSTRSKLSIIDNNKSLKVSNLSNSVEVEYLSTSVSRKETKQITSPKLSLKRKRQENNEEMSNTARKGLFSSEFNAQLIKSTLEQISASTQPCMQTSTATTSKEDSTILQNENMLNPNVRESSGVQKASNIQNENIDLPGPSHETCSVESNKQKFDLLISFCMTSDTFSEPEKLKLKSVMLKQLNSASELFISGLSFSNLIDATMANIKDCPNKINTFLVDLKEKLKLHKRTKSKIESSLQDDINMHSIATPLGQTASISQLASLSSSKNTEQNFKMDSKRTASKTIFSAEEAQRKLDQKIFKLEKHLEKLHKKIKELQARELSLEELEDEDSTYIIEDRYKRKCYEIHKTICKLKNCSHRLSFEIEKRFQFSGTRYPEVNRAVENFINKKKTEKFPNFVDILNLVKSINETIVLGIRESEYSSLAREIFEQVGNELKRRRQKDEEQNFGCYLTDDINLAEDPAEKDEELKQKLKESIIQGEQKMTEVIEKFAAQQEATKSEEEAMEEEETMAEEEVLTKEEVMAEKEAMGEEESMAEEDTLTEEGVMVVEENVSLEQKCHINDDDLPPTRPATPASEGDEPLSPGHKQEIVVVGSDSDASTDPGCHITNSCSKPNKIPLNVLSTVPSPTESDSSFELPPL